jgi:hypothetical protein
MDARQHFHARFAVLSGRTADTERVEPWDRYSSHLDVPPSAAAQLRAHWERAHRQQALDDGIHDAIEQWLERTERRVHARPGWASHEPTRLRAAAEAIAMTDYLLNVRPREPRS